jgi:hypothetical protein
MKKLFLLPLISFFLFTNLTAQNNLAPPANLQANVEGNDITLNWLSPESGEGFYLGWETGEFGNSVGLSGEGTYAVAARWEPDQITQYDGYLINKVGLYLTGEFSVFELKIWKGSNAVTEIYSQNITNTVQGDWTNVILNNPIQIDASDELWVGYEVNQFQVDFPAGTDWGPAVIGYGDMINFMGEWASMSQYYGIDYNFSIRTYLTEGNKSIVLGNNPQPAESYPNHSNLKIIDQQNNTQQFYSPLDSALFVGYNIYRNNELLNSSPISDTIFMDNNLPLGYYEYQVTAVYDLGESNPAAIQVQIGNPELTIIPDEIIDTVAIGQTKQYIITFFNEGEVDLNWTAFSDQYWIGLNPHTGSIEPGGGYDVEVYIDTYGLVAGTYTGEIDVFYNNPNQPVKTIPVTITTIGAPSIYVNPPTLSFGDVYFGNTINKTLTIQNYGTDTLQINEISSNNPAFIVDEYVTSLPPFETTTVLIGFEAATLGEINGEITISSNDPLNPQFVLPVSAFVLLEPPAFLQATVEGNDVTLNWSMGANGDGEWLNWDSGENYTAIGLTGGGSFQYAARWTPDQLTDFAGNFISKIAFFPRGYSTNYTLKIWKGENASIELVSQSINNYQADQWNEINIQNAVQIDPFQELWVGIEVDHPESDFPAGIDAGPPVPGFGDMVNLNGVWEALGTTYGIYGNWNIQVFVLNGETQSPMAQPEYELSEPKDFGNQGQLIAGDLPPVQQKFFNPKSFLLDFLGYNIYRNGEKMNETPTFDEQYDDFDLPLGIYNYGVTAVYDLGESSPLSKTVQIGTPEVVFNPEFILDTLDGATISEYIITISNTGVIDLEWMADPDVSWISLSENMGTIPPGESTELTVTLNSTGLFNGIYESFILFTVNNQNNPSIYFPVNLVVEGEALISFTVDTLDFGTVPVSQQVYKQLYVVNNGTQPVNLFSVYSNLINFQPQLTNYYVEPGDSSLILVSFIPLEIAQYDATLFLEIFTTFETYELPLTGKGGLAAPQDLSANVDSTNVNLTWFPPGVSGDLLQFGTGDPYTAIGLSGGGTFEVAARFTPEDLQPYGNKTLDQIGFYPWDVAEFTLMVYSGENAENLLIEQEVGNITPLAWNDIELSVSIPIISVDYLWFGYKITHDDMVFPAGCDFGPAVQGSGDLLSLDGETWETLTYYGLPFNWNIRGILSEGGMNQMALTPQKKNTEGYVGKKGSVSLETTNLKFSPSVVDLLGYRVYRNGELLNDSLLVQETNYIDQNLQTGTYNYEVTAVYDIGESLPAGPVTVVVEDPLLFPDGWHHHTTAMTHIVHIPTQTALANSFMSDGDWIGVFYQDNGEYKCGGNIVWAEGDSLKLIVYGDNPNTPEKEGFGLGEWMHWKVFMSQTAEEFDIEVTYNEMMPQHDGMFWMLGESALTGMNLGITGVQTVSADDVNLYPNPSNGQFTITNAEVFERIQILDMNGKIVFRQNLNDQTEMIDVSLQNGLYYIVLENSDQKISKKLIIRK